MIALAPSFSGEALPAVTLPPSLNTGFKAANFSIEKLIEQVDLSLEEIDLFEINEAFAASSIVVQEQLNIPAEKINIAGGAISLGHPIGASGARIVTTLAHQLKRTKKRFGIASLCIGDVN